MDDNANEPFPQSGYRRLILPAPVATNGTTSADIDSELFAQTFGQRWSGDYPLTEAFFYYDALALVALALQDGVHRGEAPDGAAVRAHIRAVSAAPAGSDVAWFDLAGGLEAIDSGRPVNYRGASGAADLDADGEVGNGLVRLWTVTGDHVHDDALMLAKFFLGRATRPFGSGVFRKSRLVRYVLSASAMALRRRFARVLAQQRGVLAYEIPGLDRPAVSGRGQ